MKTEIRTLKGNDGELTYTLERKKVKNLNLRVKADGSVWASASPRVPAARVDAFVESRREFVRSAKARIQQRKDAETGPKQYAQGEEWTYLDRTIRVYAVKAEWEHTEFREDRLVLFLKDPEDVEKRRKMFEKWWDAQCRQVFGMLLKRWYPIFQKQGVTFPGLKIRDMKTRWGTCHLQKKIITLNKRLLAAPIPCIEEVVAHEYCHFLQPDHSSRFYFCLSAVMPDWKARKQLLEQKVH